MVYDILIYEIINKKTNKKKTHFFWIEFSKKISNLNSYKKIKNDSRDKSIKMDA